MPKMTNNMNVDDDRRSFPTVSNQEIQVPPCFLNAANDNHLPPAPHSPSAWSPVDERVVDLFAGAGGFSLGFQRAGFPIVSAVDAWPLANSTHAANSDYPIHTQDISHVASTINLISPYNPTIIIGGPPCQDFSQAGKRNPGVRADLTVSFAEIVSTVLPKCFVMENVALARKSAAYSQAWSILSRAGYGLTEKVLDASLCGAPQRRKRLFLLGRLNAEHNWLTDELCNNLASKPLTVREYLGDELGLNNYYNHPRNYERRSVFSIDEAAPTIRGVNRIKPGQGVKDVPTNAASVLTTCGLQPEQRARLQTFPSSYRWLGSRSAKDLQIGNAVPPELAKYIASAIKRFETDLIQKAANDNALEV